jgi:hypothetical protein
MLHDEASNSSSCCNHCEITDACGDKRLAIAGSAGCLQQQQQHIMQNMRHRSNTVWYLVQAIVAMQVPQLLFLTNPPLDENELEDRWGI